MSDCENEQALFKDLVDDDKRETTSDQRAHSLVGNASKLGVATQYFDQLLYSLEKVCTELRGLCLIKESRLGEFLIDERIELRYHPPMRFRAFANASEAGSADTTPDWSSSARRLASTSRMGSSCGSSLRLSIGARAKCARSSLGRRNS